MNVILVFCVFALMGLAESEFSLNDFLPRTFNFGGTNYRFSKIERNFNDAQKICLSEGGQLFEPRSARKNYAVANAYRDIAVPALGQGHESYWLGITDHKKEGVWRYHATEARINYSNWYPGEPQQTKYLNSDCGSSGTDDGQDDRYGPSSGTDDGQNDRYGPSFHGKWNALPCSLPSYFICEFALCLDFCCFARCDAVDVAM